jgi:hypothetical protein
VSMDFSACTPSFSLTDEISAEKACPAAAQPLKSKVRSHAALAVNFSVVLFPDPLSEKNAVEEGVEGGFADVVIFGL